MIRDAPARDRTFQVASTIASVVVNICVFGGMAAASMIEPDTDVIGPPREPPIEVDLVARLGTPPDPKLLPRKPAAPAPPPPPPKEVIHTGAREEEIKKELLEKKKRDDERELERMRRDELERRRREDEERRHKEDAAKQRKEAIASALASVDNIDEDAPGRLDGDAHGNSADERAVLDSYAARVSNALQRQFQVPSIIPDELRKRLKARVKIRINDEGKLMGDLVWITKSGNEHFDAAVLRAVKKFETSGPARIPLPPLTAKDLRREVLRGGIAATLVGRL